MIRRTPVKRSKKARARRSLERQLDALVRQRVYDRDGWRCVRCGAIRGLTPSHVYPRGRYKNLQWLEINILTMDVACHLYWWHKNPCEAAEWFQKTYPDRYKQLLMLKDTMPKPDIKELLEELTQ